MRAARVNSCTVAHHPCWTVTVTFSKSAQRVETSVGQPAGLRRTTCCWPIKSAKSTSPGMLRTRPHWPMPHGVLSIPPERNWRP